MQFFSYKMNAKLSVVAFCAIIGFAAAVKDHVKEISDRCLQKVELDKSKFFLNLIFRRKFNFNFFFQMHSMNSFTKDR